MRHCFGFAVATFLKGCGNGEGDAVGDRRHSAQCSRTPCSLASPSSNWRSVMTASRCCYQSLPCTLVLLTMATIWLELSQAHTGENAPPRFDRTIGPVIKSAVLHPVILPIVGGLLWSIAALPLPAWIDQPLGFLASAAGPIMLVPDGGAAVHHASRRASPQRLYAYCAEELAHPAMVAW